MEDLLKDNLYTQVGYMVSTPEWTVIKPEDKELQAYYEVLRPTLQPLVL